MSWDWLIYSLAMVAGVLIALGIIGLTNRLTSRTNRRRIAHLEKRELKFDEILNDNLKTLYKDLSTAELQRTLAAATRSGVDSTIRAVSEILADRTVTTPDYTSMSLAQLTAQRRNLVDLQHLWRTVHDTTAETRVTHHLLALDAVLAERRRDSFDLGDPDE